MKTCNKFVSSLVAGMTCLAFGLAGCSADSSTGSDDNPILSLSSASGSTDNGGTAGESGNTSGGSGNSGTSENGGDTGNTSGESGSGNSGSANQGSGTTASSSASNSGTNTATAISSSAAKTETVSSEEVLNAASKVVNGTCGPKVSEIARDSMATWQFNRVEGDLFTQILAPFVWTFSDGKTIQGNGLNSVNLRYHESGTVTAQLSVDGNVVDCDPLQVQGEPITIESCKADKSTAQAGETITWTVVASSAVDITGYVWTSTAGDVTGSGTTGTMTATSSMHKQSVSATVAVANSDKTVQSYSCDGVTVIDPNFVDIVLTLKSINDLTESNGKLDVPDSLIIASGTPVTVQIPTGAPANCTVGCKPIVGADYMSTEVTFGGTLQSNFAYFSPTGCAPGQKYTVEASVSVFCSVNP